MTAGKEIVMSEQIDYQKAYEEEHLRCADLAGRVADLEAKCDDLNYRLDRIKNNPLWKASTPLRKCMHFVIRQKDRLKNCGNLRGVAAKLKYKKIERQAMERYGTKSFPDEATAKAQREEKFPRMVKISILVPLWNNKREFQIEMLNSVMNQTYQNWELCLADGSDAEHSYIGDICREYAEKAGGRIVYKKLDKNGGISGNTNECLKLATGEYIGLFDHDDILHPTVLFEYVKAINEQGADYIYCDEATFTKGQINKMITLHFKPDYAIDNLRANNYICHFSLFKKSLLQETELFRTEFDGSQDHDMILRLTSLAKNVVHVPKILYYWRAHAGSVASDISAKLYCIDAAKRAVADHLRNYDIYNTLITSTRAFETIFRLQYELTAEPKVSIVIPTCDQTEYLKKCIDAIESRNTYGNYEILVVENNSKKEETFAYYESLKENPNVRLLTYQGEFNYSKINN